MKRINSTDIQQWAETLKSKSTLSLLIRKLIFASKELSEIIEIDFPAGDDVHVGGYDGKLNSKSEFIYIPSGESVWEFGIDKNKKKKADHDYHKRKLDPIGQSPLKTTYIGVTAYKWGSKAKWCKERREEKYWKEVHFYDAVDLEHWLELAPSVAVWFSAQIGKPITGMHDFEDYWKNWAIHKNGLIPTQLLTVSRENERDEIDKFIENDQESVLYVKSNTIEESLAFSLGHFLDSDLANNEIILSNSIIVEDKESYRQLICLTKNLIIIPTFLIETFDINASQKGDHKLIIPVSNSYTGNNYKVINLKIPDSSGFIEILKSMGYSSAYSKNLASQSSRNVVVLRRILNMESSKPKWFNTSDLQKLITIAFFPRFTATNDHDKAIIAQFANAEHSTFNAYLKTLAYGEESPLFQVDSNWRVMSHADMWIQLARYISLEDLEKFKRLAINILSEEDPKYKLDENERMFAAIKGEVPKYSTFLKKGICESLIMINVLSKTYGLDSYEPEHIVDSIIEEVLSNGSADTWKTLGENLTLLAEASPKAFLHSLETIIENRVIANLFKEEKGFLNSYSEITNVLWALDIIAWMPEYLLNVCSILCQLIELGPKEYPSSNTPFATLQSIFTSWFPQTNANVNERLQILDYLKIKFPKITFELCNDLIYEKRAYAMHKPRMKWRLFTELKDIQATREEIIKANNYFLDTILAMSSSSNDVEEVLKIIKKLDDYHEWNKFDEAIEAISKFKGHEITNAKIYHELRNFVGHHRSFPKSEWALSETQNRVIEMLAKQFEPKDLLLRESYIFEDDDPIGFQGEVQDVDWKKKQKTINSKRKKLITRIIKECGIEVVIANAVKSKHPHHYGIALGAIKDLPLKIEREIIQLAKIEDEKAKIFVTSFISLKEKREGQRKMIEYFKNFTSKKRKIQEQVTFLLGLKSNITLWKFVESYQNKKVEVFYWQSLNFIYPKSFRELKFSLNKLIEFRLYVTAIKVLGHYRSLKELSSDFLMNFFKSLSLNNHNEKPSITIDSYSIRSIFKELQEREDIDQEKLALIEYQYVFIFDRLGEGLKPINLYKDLSKSPEKFVHILKDAFPSENPEITKMETKLKVSNGDPQSVFELSYFILNHCNIVPGTNESGMIDEKKLNEWVDKVRELAKDSVRTKIADIYIGKLLARYGQSIEYPTEIWACLERIGTKKILSGFSVQMYNKGGILRPAGTGGEFERNLSKMNELAFEKTQFKFPKVANIYRQRAAEYAKEAQRENQISQFEDLD